MKKTILGSLLTVATIGLLVKHYFPSQHTFTFPVQINAEQPPDFSSAPVDRDEATGNREDWPQWQGVRRDGRAAVTDLLSEWPAEGPPLLWKATGLGQGMSSVAIAEQSVFTLGVQSGRVRLVCLNVQDGSERWITEIGEGGEPNGTPTVDGDQVFAITREGKIVCADVETGSIAWTRDFVSDFGGSIPTWGYSESPLVDGQRVICTPGADAALMVALDRSTGNLIWQSPCPEQMRNKGHAGAGYSSAVVSDAAGAHQYVQMIGCGAIGVSATHGAPLWGYSRVANDTAVIPTPLVQGDYVLVSSGYGAGAALLHIVRKNSGFEPVEVYFHSGNEVQNHHGGMVLVNGYVYLGHGHNKGLPLCMELLSGKVQWGPERGAGSGSAAVVYADNRLYFRYEDARMALIEATPSGYHLVSSFKLPSNLGKSWPHPAIARRCCFLRDQDVLLCYNLAKHTDKEGADAVP